MSFDKSKVLQYMDWLKIKLMLDVKSTTSKSRIVQRGQVYYCNLGRGIGQEQEKERPCVILQNDSQNISSPNTIVAPITHTSSKVNVVVPITTQTDARGTIILDGHALLGNMVTVSKARLGAFVTKLPKNDMNNIDNALMISLELGKFKNIIADKNIYIDKLLKERISLKNELHKINQAFAELEKENAILKTK